MKSTMQTMTTIDLEDAQMLALDGDRHDRVSVLYGATWLTEEGEAGDTVLRAGGEHALGHGRVLIAGLGPTRVRVAVRTERVATRLAAWLRRVLQEARWHIARLQLGPAAQPPRG